MAQRLARRAHNPEVVCSNHTAGILQFARFTETGRQSLVTLNTATLHRRGAEAARRAHNPEVTRSRRVAGILQFARFTETGRQSLSDAKHEHLLPVWRSGQRAGLITLRSGVRITSPVFYNSCVLLSFRSIPQLSWGDKKHIVKA